MKKKFLVALCTLIGVVIGVVVYISSTSVTVNGVDYKLSTLSSDFDESLKESYPVFIKDELNRFVTYEYDLTNILDRNLFEKVKSKLSGTDYHVDYTYNVDFDRVASWLNNYNSSAVKSRNAKIITGRKKFKIRPEVYGTQVDIDSIEDCLKDMSYNINIEDYMIQPKVKSKDLEATLKKANSYVTWSYAYDNGKVVKSSIDYVSVTNKNKIKVDDSWIDNAVRVATNSYNTVGIPRKFKTHSGKKITVSGGTWGSEVSYDVEIDKVKKAFHSGKSKTGKRPTYLYHREAIGGTYVEVSISSQHVWVYKDKKCVLDTSCVTGTKGVHDTPRGMYYMLECRNGKWLTGDDYRTWVDKWMRITWTGIGLHDATWRSSFGGSIYTYSGSHGCINLPSTFASSLLKLSYIGMPVVVY